MKNKLFAILLLLILNINSNAQHLKTEPITKDSITTITISFVGDLMCHSSQFGYAMLKDSTYNFKPVYKYVKKYLSNTDFTIGNLETVLGGDSVQYRGYPLFNTPDEFLTALKYAGFDLLITANNHSLDLGEYGLRRTIEQIKKDGLYYRGTFLSIYDRDEVKIIEIKGIKLSILSYTYGTNGNLLPKGKRYLINTINLKKIKNDIIKSRKEKADVVIVYYHFGKEYKRHPTKYQNQVVDSTINLGADIIIGSHTHVIQTGKFFNSGNGFVAYSLGNFISNQRWRYSNGGVILTIKFIKNYKINLTSIENVNYIPTYVFKGKVKGKNSFIIIPEKYYKTSLVYPFFADSTYKEMFQSFDDTHAQFKYLDKKLILSMDKMK